MKPLNVLISLHKGYGLGDAVQMSAVLRHVTKHRSNWRVDYQAEEGYHQVGRGTVASTFAYGQPYPSQRYDAEVQIRLFDTWYGWEDRPNTRVSSCLRECFGLDWDAQCGRYRVDVDRAESEAAEKFVRRGHSRESVAVHYLGDSAPDKKNLTHAQAAWLCGAVRSLRREPLLLDYRRQSPLDGVRTTAELGTEWGRDAARQCAVIGRCAAFVGIDSGPAKCASATGIPSLVVWTGHHPAPFHDPADNTTHLVPVGYHGLQPVCGDRGVIDWFERHHTVLHYEQNPVDMVRYWLRGVLG